MKKIICKICKKKFFCNSLDIKKCWCYLIPTKLINDKLNNCICKDCLIKIPNLNNLFNKNYVP